LLHGLPARDLTANEEHVDGLNAALGEDARVNLRFVDLEAIGGDGRGDGREESGAILGDDDQPRVRFVAGHDAELGDLRVAGRYQCGRDSGAPPAQRYGGVGRDLLRRVR